MPMESHLVGVYEHHEGVALARHVLLPFQVLRDQLRRIRDQEVKVPATGHSWHT